VNLRTGDREASQMKRNQILKIEPHPCNPTAEGLALRADLLAKRLHEGIEILDAMADGHRQTGGFFQTGGALFNPIPNTLVDFQPLAGG
jgi:hypothetical protein